jgi:hypothetical protein
MPFGLSILGRLGRDMLFCLGFGVVAFFVGLGEAGGSAMT